MHGPLLSEKIRSESPDTGKPSPKQLSLPLAPLGLGPQGHTPTPRTRGAPAPHKQWGTEGWHGWGEGQAERRFWEVGASRAWGQALSLSWEFSTSEDLCRRW